MEIKDKFKRGINKYLRSEKKEFAVPGEKMESGQYKNRCDIRSAEGENIKIIEENAFAGCDGLTAVRFPQAKCILTYAFSECKKLEKVELPLVEEIGERAFNKCEGLVEINIPEATRIHKEAFIDCENLTEVYFPKATELDEYVFKDCKKLIVLDFPELNKIIEGAFEGLESLRSAEFDKVTEVGSNAFKDCKSLKMISMCGLQKDGIGEEIFEGCDNLNNIFVKDSDICLEMYNKFSEEFKARVDDCKINMFYGGNIPWRNINLYTKDNGKTFDLPDKVKIIRQSMFNGFSECKDGMKAINANEVVKIFDNAFEGFTRLEKVNCPKLESIGQNVFDGCKNLKEIYVPAEPLCYDVYNSLSQELQEKVNDKSLSIYYYDGDAAKLFESKNVIKNYNVNDKTFKILQEDGCSFISPVMLNEFREEVEVIIGEWVTEVRDNTFSGCSALKSVYLRRLKEVGNNLFEGCTSLSRIHAGTSEDICKSIYYKLPDDLREKVRNKDDKLILSYYIGGEETQGWNYMNAYTESEGKIFVLPEEIKEINFEMFNDYKEVVTEVYAPGVTEVGKFAFYDCENLKVLELGRVTSLDIDAFEGCSNLERIRACNEDKEIYEMLPAYLKKKYDDKELKINGKDCEGTLEDSIAACTKDGGIKFELTERFRGITSEMFNLYKDKVEVVKANYVTNIEDNAFRGCERLTVIYLKEIKEIGNNLFEGCNQLKEIYVIDESVCKKLCDSLSDTLKEKVKNGELSLNYYADDGKMKTFDCKYYDLGNKFTKYYDMSGGNAILRLPEGINEMTSEILEGYKDKIEEIYASEVNKVGTGVLSNCNRLRIVELGNVIELGNDAFAGCEELEEIKVKNEEIEKFVSEILPDDALLLFKNNKFKINGNDYDGLNK